jgi:hypothetical protein
MKAGFLTRHDSSHADQANQANQIEGGLPLRFDWLDRLAELFGQPLEAQTN